jgi:hypothetical protein
MLLGNRQRTKNLVCCSGKMLSSRSQLALACYTGRGGQRFEFRQSLVKIVDRYGIQIHYIEFASADCHDDAAAALDLIGGHLLQVPKDTPKRCALAYRCSPVDAY